MIKILIGITAINIFFVGGLFLAALSAKGVGHTLDLLPAPINNPETYVPQQTPNACPHDRALYQVTQHDGGFTAIYVTCLDEGYDVNGLKVPRDEGYKLEE